MSELKLEKQSALYPLPWLVCHLPSWLPSLSSNIILCLLAECYTISTHTSVYMHSHTVQARTHMREEESLFISLQTSWFHFSLELNNILFRLCSRCIHVSVDGHLRSSLGTCPGVGHMVILFSFLRISRLISTMAVFICTAAHSVQGFLFLPTSSPIFIVYCHFFFFFYKIWSCLANCPLTSDLWEIYKKRGAQGPKQLSHSFLGEPWLQRGHKGHMQSTTCQALTCQAPFEALYTIPSWNPYKNLNSFLSPSTTEEEAEPTGSLPRGPHLGTMVAKVSPASLSAREPADFAPCSHALLSSLQPSWFSESPFRLAISQIRETCLVWVAKPIRYLLNMEQNQSQYPVQSLRVRPSRENPNPQTNDTHLLLIQRQPDQQVCVLGARGADKLVQE